MPTLTSSYSAPNSRVRQILRAMTVIVTALIAFSAGQAQEAVWQWAKSAGGTGKDAFTTVGRDASGGNVFVAGYFSNSMVLGPSALISAGGTDVVLARYHPSGAPIWSLRFGGPGNDAAMSLAVDAGGNVFVVGTFENRMVFGTDTLNSAGGTDIFILKYSAAGNYLWSRRAGGPGADIAKTVAVDAVGNAFIGGAFADSIKFGLQPWLYSTGGTDMFIAQYSSDGDAQWAVRAGGIGTDIITGLVVNTSGIYATGSFTDSLTVGADNLTSAGNADIFIAKYSIGGAPQWTRQAGGTGLDYGNAIALDLAGNILIGGTTGDSAAFGAIQTGKFGGQDGFATQYSATGTAQWARIMGGAGDDNITSIVADSAGAAYCTGYFSQTAALSGLSLISAGLTDVFTAKYSSSGAIQWAQRGGGPDADFAYDINLNVNRSTYICGSFYYEAIYANTVLGGQGDYDMFIARLTNVEPNDVGVADILFPAVPFAPGASQISAIIRNYGTTVMDTVRVEWEFNGTAQTTVYSGKDIAPGQRDTILLGTPVFPEKMFSLVTARTALPNNGTDPNASNDEFAKAMGPGLLKGTYTLGGTSPDFVAFSEAGRYLNICGVLDTVFIDVRNGIYNEQFILKQVPGVTADKRLTIRSQPGQVDRPQINYAPIYSNNNYSLLLDGADWITIQGLAINAAGIVHNRAVLLQGGTMGIIFDSNAVYSPITAAADGGMMSAPNNDCSDLTAIGNIFNGGVYGIRIQPVAYVAGLNIRNNKFENYSQVGVEADRITGSYFHGNLLRTTSENAVGILLTAISGGTRITGNAIREIPSGTGIHLRNSSGTVAEPLLLANNMTLIGAGNTAAQGMAIDTCQFINVYHNTINQTSTAPNESAFIVRGGGSINVVNNLFYNSGGGFAYSIKYKTATVPVIRSDFNALYSAGPILGSYTYDTNTIWAANIAAWRVAPIALDSHSVSKVVTFGSDITHLSAVDSLLFGDVSLRTIVNLDFDGQTRRSPYMGADEVIPKITITDQTEYRQIFCLGSTAVFYVNANISHAGKLHYQWQMNGIDIPDSTNPTITFTNVNRNSEAFFRCIITGNSGADTVISDRIQLMVINATEILRDPKTRYVLAEQTAEFEVLAEASPPNGANQVIYKWFRNGTQLFNSMKIAGATTSMLKIFNVQLSDVDSNYYCTVDGACGSDTSARFSLLMPGAAFGNQPRDTSVCMGDTTQLTASVITGIPGQELRYEWQRGGTPLTDGPKFGGVGTGTLTVKNVAPADTGSDYRLKVLVVATGAILYSDNAAIRLNTATAITASPIAAQACENKPHTFSVAATGVNLLYQWQRNDTNIAGANGATYTIPVVEKGSAGKYRVVITGKCGTITSSAVELTIKAIPFVIVNPPKTYTATIGRTLSITVNIGGPTPIRYSWYHNGTLIPNQKSNILILDSAEKSDTGRYWCVAENDCGSTQTDTCIVRVEPLSVENDGANMHAFGIESVSPNPVINEAEITYSVASSGFARLTLTDALGREVLSIFTGEVDYGKHSIYFDASGLAAGRYYCVLTTPTGAVSLPVTILK
ncbi:MAG: immunoglobulin domain-containing protein [Bacteroidetes bacterium]|nr:immunoglobulin domain-containing protein [Bacteroidota bacterium]